MSKMLRKSSPLRRSSLAVIFLVAAFSSSHETARSQELTSAPPAPAVKIEAPPPEFLIPLPTPADERAANRRGGGQTATANGTFAPLTAGEKTKRAFRSAFLSPQGYALTAIGATITEAGERDQPHKTTEDRVADGLSRFAINFGTRATRVLLGSGVYPVLLKQDPRYRPSPKKGFGARLSHAASRVFVTDGDDGRPQPNYSRLAGHFSASALANVWQRSTPGHDRIGVDATFSRFGFSVGFDVLQHILFKEFGPDILRRK